MYPIASVAQMNPWVRTNWPTSDAQGLYDMTIDPSGRIWVVTYEAQGSYHGVFRSDDNGDSWIPIDFPETNLTAIATDAFGHIFIGTWRHGIYRSTNDGDTWTQTGPPTLGVQDIACSSIGSVFATTFGDSALYRSTDGGVTWTPKIKGIQFQAIPISTDPVVTGPDSLVYVSCIGIFRSTDNGENWVSISQGYDLDAHTLLLTSPGHIFAGCQSGGVYRTTNDGVNWEQANFGSSVSFIRSLVVNSNGVIFRGTDGGGVFYSDDEGDNWYDFNSGLTDLSIFGLAVNSTGFVFAATNSHGVYRTTFSTTSVDREEILPHEITLFQNYPNPFNPTTIISYSIPTSGHVVLKVMNILGEEVQTLVDEIKSQGYYTVQFNGSHFSSGIYFYRIQADGFSKTRAMTILQ
jgi:ligand-binding sensor domain-containing protein